VAVHDGARPHVTPAAILRCWELAKRHGCAACAAPVTDTLKKSGPEAGDPLITGDVDREHLWAMQTPQIARREELLGALDHAADRQIPITDETSAIRALGRPVALSANPDWNPKITYPRDLRLSEAWIELKSRERADSAVRD
jgi:2-C-methyl-D-erythritol 4-phosphate cytidylyltransferase